MKKRTVRIFAIILAALMALSLLPLAYAHAEEFALPEEMPQIPGFTWMGDHYEETEHIYGEIVNEDFLVNPEEPGDCVTPAVYWKSCINPNPHSDTGERCGVTAEAAWTAAFENVRNELAQRRANKEQADFETIFINAIEDLDYKYKFTAGGTGHQWVEHWHQEAACTSDGWETYYVCSVCGMIIGEDGTVYDDIPVIPATGHRYVDGVCEVCGAIDENYIPEELSFTAGDTAVFTGEPGEDSDGALPEEGADQVPDADPETPEEIEDVNPATTLDPVEEENAAPTEDGEDGTNEDDENDINEGSENGTIEDDEFVEEIIETEVYTGEVTVTQEAASDEVVNSFLAAMSELGLDAENTAINIKDVTPIKEDGSELSDEEIAAMGGIEFDMELPADYNPETDTLQVYHYNEEKDEWELMEVVDVKDGKVIVRKVSAFSPFGLIVNRKRLDGVVVTVQHGNTETYNAGTEKGIPGLRVTLDGASRADVRTVFVDDVLQAVLSKREGTTENPSLNTADYTYQWYTKTKAGRETPISGATGTTYTVKAGDLDKFVFCSVLRDASTGDPHAEASDSYAVRQPVTIYVNVKGQGTVSYKDTDEIVPTEIYEEDITPIPTVLGSPYEINTISGNEVSVTFAPDAEMEYWLKNYSGLGEDGDYEEITQKEQTLTFTVPGTSDSQNIYITFAMVSASPEIRGTQDTNDYRDRNDPEKTSSTSKLKEMTDGMGEGVVVGSIVYVTPIWDDNGTEVDKSSQLPKTDGVDFDLDYPSAEVKANKDDYSIRVYHYSYADTAWSQVPDSQVELGSDVITVKNYKDFSPFVPLAVPANVTLTYKAGEGTGSDVTKHCVDGDTITLPDPTTDTEFSYQAPTDKPNFKGWNDGSQIHAAGESFTVSGNQTLTAEWTTEISITFKPGDTDGSGTITGSMAQITKAVGANVTLPEVGFSYENHTFTGWTDQNGKGYADKGTFTAPAENLTLTAHWDRTKYTVTYDGNGGGDPSDSKEKVQDVDVDKPVTFKENMFTVPYGQKFIGWNEKSDGSGEKTYQPGESATLNKDVTLYAIWKEEVEIYYYPNGAGTGDYTIDKVVADVATNLKTLDELGFAAYEGQTFIGWNHKNDGSGTTTYDDGAEITIPTGATLEDRSFYALWADKVTITYNANGGSGTMEPQDVPINQEATLNENKYTRSSYLFMNWNTQADGKGKPYTDKIPASEVTANITLYAQWIGPVRISGQYTGTDEDAYVGETLTATVTGLTDDSDITYLWGVVDGNTFKGITTETKKTFTPSAAYADKTIACRVMKGESKAYSNRKTISDTITSVAWVQDIINGGDFQKYPSASYYTQVGRISGVVNGMQVSINDGTWATVSGVTNGILNVTTPGTYVFRYNEGGAESNEITIYDWYTVGFRYSGTTTTSSSGTTTSANGTVRMTRTSSSSASAAMPTSPVLATATAAQRESNAIMKLSSTVDNVWVVKKADTTPVTLTVTPSSGSYAHVSLNGSNIDNFGNARTSSSSSSSSSSSTNSSRSYAVNPDRNNQWIRMPMMYIITFNNSSSSPQTSDESQLGLWSALCLVSLAGAAMILGSARKRRESK